MICFLPPIGACRLPHAPAAMVLRLQSFSEHIKNVDTNTVITIVMILVKMMIMDMMRMRIFGFAVVERCAKGNRYSIAYAVVSGSGWLSAGSLAAENQMQFLNTSILCWFFRSILVGSASLRELYLDLLS